MKKLSSQAFIEIRTWIYRHARPLELALWQYHFENGTPEAVLSALSFYQNEDGGFGHALEPDNWNPHSSPYTTLYALHKLSEIHFTDTAHPMMRGIFRFLEDSEYHCENGWMFNIPSNDHYPRAPWWNYSREANEYESVGVSLGIACFVLKLAEKDSFLYKRAMTLIEKLITRLQTDAPCGDMGIGGYCQLRDTLINLGLTNQFDLALLSDSIKRLVFNAIERDVSRWAYYGKRPSSFISSPDSEYYRENEDITQKELDYLIETRPEDEVWGITWSWFEHNEKYSAAFAIAENWWKASSAIDKLQWLKNFNRLS